MGTHKSTIEINGKRYDAITGAFLGEAAGTMAAPSRTIDGFRPGAQPAGKTTSVRAAASHVAAHKPVPSKTLMRTAVKKPSVKAAATLKARTRTDILARQPQQTIAPKVSYGAIDRKRLKKATQMVQNPAVSHYGSVHEVAATPISYAAKAGTPLARTLDSFRTAKAKSSASVVPNLPVSEMRAPQAQPDIFEQAMARATSHEQTFDDKQLKRRRSRIGLLATAGVSLLMLVAVFAYFNVPQLSLRLASARAGFPAKLPAYSPVGYSFGNLSYGPGNVTINYKLDGSHKFDITQRASSWDSQALLSNFVASANKAYQTYERAGRTIYFFGNDTATWVDNGVWYTVNGNNSLTKNQLLDLASSI